MTRHGPNQPLQEPSAVAGLPRLFVGQVPTSKYEQDLLPLFSKYGEVETIMLVRGPDQKSRGCAMVQFKRWADAEAAMEALNGTSPLDGSKGRHLVVNFANPRRGSAIVAGEIAIAPRKLFVGQIPKDCTDGQLAEVFSRFGEIELLNLLEAKGQQTKCAFIQFKKWAACEAAIEELSGRHVMPGSEHPLLVKFADAARSRSDSAALVAGAGPQGSSDSSSGQFYGFPPSGHVSSSGGYLSNANSRRSNGGGSTGTTSSPAAGIPHGAMHYMHPPQGMLPPGAYMTGHPAEMGHHMQLMPHPYGQPPHGAFQNHGMGIPLSGLPGVPGLLQGAGGRSRSSKAASSSGGAPSSRRGLGSSGGNGSSDSLGDVSDGSIDQQHLIGGNGVAPIPAMHPMMALHDAMHHQYAMHGMPAAYMGYPMMAMAPMAPPQARKVGRGVVDPGVYVHKLFVGQVPFEATEQDIWHMFAPFGDILELAVLRAGGVSKGCAFLTYATKQQALHAMSALHGQQVGPNKRLVVKFADHKPSPALAAALPMTGVVSASVSASQSEDIAGVESTATVLPVS